MNDEARAIGSRLQSGDRHSDVKRRSHRCHPACFLAALTIGAATVLHASTITLQQPEHGDEFLLEVWGYPTANVETRTVDNTLAALRKKIELDPAHPSIVLTVRGKGYRWGD